MTIADLKALREVPGCGQEVQVNTWVEDHQHAADSAYYCDACLSLLAAAVIRQAVARLSDSRIAHLAEMCADAAAFGEAQANWAAAFRALLPDTLLPTPPTTEDDDEEDRKIYGPFLG